LEVPSSWSRDQRLYPKALDTSIKNLDPFVSDVRAFFPEDSDYTSCNPWDTADYCKDITKYEEYGALWQAKYQTQLGGSALKFQEGRSNYCDLKFWETKYDEWRNTYEGDIAKELIDEPFYPQYWSDEQIARYKSSTKPVPVTTSYLQQ